MCIGLPMRVVEMRDGMALAECHGMRHVINALLVPDLRPGDWTLVFQGRALRALAEAEALDIDVALSALAAILFAPSETDVKPIDLEQREREFPGALRHAAEP